MTAAESVQSEKGIGRSRLTELHAVEDTGVGASTSAVQDLDADNVGVLGDTEGLASNGTGDVASVAVLVIGLRSVLVDLIDTEEDSRRVDVRCCRRC